MEKINGWFIIIQEFLKTRLIKIFRGISSFHINKETKRVLINMAILFISILLSVKIITHIPEIRKTVMSAKGSAELFAITPNDSIQALKVSLEKSLAKLQKKAGSFTPYTPYIVVNTTLNEFWMYNKKTLVREGKCSTGSYIQLEGTDRKWIFKTPRGEFRIHGKTTSPVWRKPDWAFVEEGLPVPSGDHPSRYEYGVLGDYAMSIGQGYLIHGTLYKRYLGSAVTHGCIRLNDDDLEKAYQTLNIGSKVYIY